MRHETATQILDTAQDLLQTHGYNGFSYADIATVVGIRTASIHYYYPTKSDLGRALVARYRNEASTARAALVGDARCRLERYVARYRTTLGRGDRLCPCTMLSADFADLPEALCDEVQGFLGDTIAWLSTTLEEGRRAGLLQFSGESVAQAHLLYAVIQGASLTARCLRDSLSYDVITRQLLATLQSAPSPAMSASGPGLSPLHQAL